MHKYELSLTKHESRGKIILNSFSEELCYITCIDFYWLKKIILRVCCCLFDYYIYKISTKSTFLLYRDVYKEKDIGYAFIKCTIDCFIYVCYTCVFTLIKIKRFNNDLLNETLRQACHTCLCDSHILRMQGTTKTCFQNLKVYLEKNECNANYATCVCCFECLKQFIYNFLYDDFCTLDF